jgi:hypothetical protein
VLLLRASPQFLLYPKNGDVQKYLLRCLNSYTMLMDKPLTL